MRVVDNVVLHTHQIELSLQNENLLYQKNEPPSRAFVERYPVLWKKFITIGGNNERVNAIKTILLRFFSTMLSELGAQLPLSTRIVIGISDIVKTWLAPVLAAMVLAVLVAMYQYRNSNRFRTVADALQLRLPLFGGLQRKSAVSRFSRTFGALLTGGVPIADALEITSTTTGNRILEMGF
jgi:hypothetical protein